MPDIPWAAIAPLLVLAAAFIISCLVDLARTPVKHLPKWGWAIVCIGSIPLGAIAYLIFGRDPGRSE